MKKTLLLAAITAILLVFVIPVNAESDRIKIKELDMSFSAPEGWTVLTRNVSEDERYLHIMGITKKDLISNFKENNIYASVISDSSMDEIVIKMFTDENIKDIYNMSKLSDSYLENMKNELVDKHVTSSSINNYLSNTVLKQGELTFIVCDIEKTENNTKYPGIQYYTIYNGKGLSVVYTAFDNNISENDKAVLKGIIESMEVSLKEKPINNPFMRFLNNNSWVVLGFAVLILLIALALIVLLRKKRAKAE